MRHKAHRVSERIRAKSQQGLPEISLGAHAHHWDGQAQHERGHADRENTIGDSGQAVEVRASKLIEAVPAAAVQIQPVRMTEATDSSDWVP